MIKANSFINMLVLKKLLNGLTMNKITIIIDAKEHRQIVLVWSLYSEILFEFIIILLYYYNNIFFA